MNRIGFFLKGEPYKQPDPRDEQKKYDEAMRLQEEEGEKAKSFEAFLAKLSITPNPGVVGGGVVGGGVVEGGVVEGGVVGGGGLGGGVVGGGGLGGGVVGGGGLGGGVVEGGVVGGGVVEGGVVGRGVVGGGNAVVWEWWKMGSRVM